LIVGRELRTDESRNRHETPREHRSPSIVGIGGIGMSGIAEA